MSAAALAGVVVGRGSSSSIGGISNSSSSSYSRVSLPGAGRPDDEPPHLRRLKVRDRLVVDAEQRVSGFQGPAHGLHRYERARGKSEWDRGGERRREGATARGEKIEN